MIVIFAFNVDLNEKTITYKSVDGRTSKEVDRMDGIHFS